MPSFKSIAKIPAKTDFSAMLYNDIIKARQKERQTQAIGAKNDVTTGSHILEAVKQLNNAERIALRAFLIQRYNYFTHNANHPNFDYTREKNKFLHRIENPQLRQVMRGKFAEADQHLTRQQASDWSAYSDYYLTLLFTFGLSTAAESNNTLNPELCGAFGQAPEVSLPDDNAVPREDNIPSEEQALELPPQLIEPANHWIQPWQPRPNISFTVDPKTLLSSPSPQQIPLRDYTPADPYGPGAIVPYQAPVARLSAQTQAPLTVKAAEPKLDIQETPGLSQSPASTQQDSSLEQVLKPEPEIVDETDEEMAVRMQLEEAAAFTAEKTGNDAYNDVEVFKDEARWRHGPMSDFEMAAQVQQAVMPPKPSPKAHPKAPQQASSEEVAIQLQIEEAAKACDLSVPEYKAIYFPDTSDADIAKQIQSARLQDFQPKANPSKADTPELHAIMAVETVMRVAVKTYHDAASNHVLLNFSIQCQTSMLQSYGVWQGDTLHNNTYVQSQQISSIEGTIAGKLTAKGIAIETVQLSEMQASVLDLNGMLAQTYNQFGFFAHKQTPMPNAPQFTAKAAHENELEIYSKPQTI